jgi:hypothetical protein
MFSAIYLALEICPGGDSTWMVLRGRRCTGRSWREARSPNGHQVGSIPEWPLWTVMRRFVARMKLQTAPESFGFRAQVINGGNWEYYVEVWQAAVASAAA